MSTSRRGKVENTYNFNDSVCAARGRMVDGSGNSLLLHVFAGRAINLASNMHMNLALIT